MKDLQTWLSLYAQSHQNPTNKKIHMICVPLIMWSLLGLIWCIPTPEMVTSKPWANWAFLFVLLTLPFYMMLSIRVTLVIIVTAIICLASFMLLENLKAPLISICLIVFVLAWIGQFIGHKIEGKKPSFFEDLQFLLIGPLWVFKALKLPIG